MQAKTWVFLGLMSMAAQVWAQGAENPDYRIRAELRSESGESVGNSDFRVKSRFMQIYYGGVSRSDEFRFSLQINSLDYANLDLDVILDTSSVADYLVGMFSTDNSGLLDVTFRSDYHLGDAPDLPLPVDFPEPIGPGDGIRIFDHLTQSLLLSAFFEEEFVRGDVNQDKEVDELDFAFLAANFGSNNAIGPANGDFTGDNRSNIDDYNTFVANFTGDGPVPAAPSPVPLPATVWLLGAGASGLLARRRSRSV